MSTGRRRAGGLVLVVLLVAAGGTGCGRGGDGRRLTVLAASSLTEVFDTIGRRFEAAHPEAGVRFGFSASSALAAQVRDGAPADVVATADRRTVDDLAGAGLTATASVFARNRLAILVAAGNPHGIRTLADLARPGLVVVLCAEQVPCGSLAARALGRAGVAVRARSLEPDVKAVVSRVVLGEADAGLVYATDVRAAAGRADGVALSPEDEVATAYAAAPVVAGADAGLARAFVAFLRSAPAREALVAAGFEAP
ncbi:MAG: molybdate ABC transporter substrate-binding protein [Actinomycetota bacterium]